MTIEHKQIGGNIPLRDGYAFIWMAAPDGEISGFIAQPDGAIVKGSSGWWRTKDAEQAARRAAALYLGSNTKDYKDQHDR